MKKTVTTKKIITERRELELPEIIGASLLTLEELNEGADYIKPTVFWDQDDYLPPVWYLRTIGDDIDCVKYAEIGPGNKFNGEEETEIDFYDEGPEDRDPYAYGTGTRPALYFASSLLDAGLRLGDSFFFDEMEFTVITDKIALCDSYISREIFDDKTSVYENSAIKKRIDAWFKSALEYED